MITLFRCDDDAIIFAISCCRFAFSLSFFSLFCCYAITPRRHYSAAADIITPLDDAADHIASGGTMPPAMPSCHVAFAFLLLSAAASMPSPLISSSLRRC